MAADDVVRGAAKAGSWLSDILGVADDAIAPSLRKTFTRFLGEMVPIQGQYKAEDILSSGASGAAVKRMADLADKRMNAIRNRSIVTKAGILSPEENDLMAKLNIQSNVIRQLSDPSVGFEAKLTNAYGGITDDSAEILNKALERTAGMMRNNEGIYQKVKEPVESFRNTRHARSILLNRRRRFQEHLFGDELATEFGEDSAAPGLFNSFVRDGMSPLDARDAVRALLGGQ